MGKKSRDKGLGYEREVVNAFQEAGIHAERVPLSGAAGGSFTGDVTAAIVGEDRLFECKRKADGFSLLYRWLGLNYGLCLRADRSPGLVVLRQSDFLALVNAAGERRASDLAREERFQRAVESGLFNGLNYPHVIEGAK